MKKNIWCILFIFLLTLMEAFTREVTCMRLPDIYWNSTNPIFRIDNTDHIIDVNKGNIPFEYDQVNIICPVYMPGTHEEDAEKYIIYNVSKEEYDTCRITNPNPRIIAICDKPYKLMYFTITFRSFTPQPGGLEFQPGQDYYFISTSSKDDLHRRIGGRCSSHNMKVVFKVCCRPDLNLTVFNRQPSTLISSTTSSSYSTSTMMTTSTANPTTIRPTSSYKDFDLHNYNIKSSTKKTSEYDKHPNEVVKNEELTYNHAIRISAANYIVLLMFTTVVLFERLVGR